MYEANQIEEETEELLNCQFPQPFCGEVDGMDRTQLVNLKTALTIKRMDIDQRLDGDGMEDGDQRFRAKDKKRWLMKKLTYVDALIVKVNARAKMENSMKGNHLNGAKEPTVATLIMYFTDRDGDRMALTSLDATEWWIRQVENLDESQQDIVPLDLKPRSITQSQLDRLPAWMKDAMD